MTKTTRARYTLEFKQEAVRLVKSGQSIAAAARTLGVVDQTVFNWVKAQRAGKLSAERGHVQGRAHTVTGSMVGEIGVLVGAHRPGPAPSRGHVCTVMVRRHPQSRQHATQHQPWA